MRKPWMKKMIKAVDCRLSTVDRKTLLLVMALSFMMSPGVVICAEAKTPTKTEKKELTVAEISKQVEEAQAAMKDVQMDPTMEMKDTLSGSQQNSKGKVKMKSPDKIYVHYTQPEEQYLYIGGGLVQMYQPSQKTVFRQPSGKGKDAAPVYLGVGKELKRYISISHVTLFKNNDSEVGLLFNPNDSLTAGFDRMRVFIHKKDWWPYQMEVETPSLNTKAKFSNFSFNKGLKEDQFKFVPPKGAQVVEGSVF
jgi:outer membrane lipoprotein-sorting protein